MSSCSRSSWVLPHLGSSVVLARCSLSRSRLSAPRTPASCRRARAKARLRSASARHSAVGCRCAPRPGAVPFGSGTTDQDPGPVLRVRPCDHSQQLTLGGSLPASDAGPDGSVGPRVRACRVVKPPSTISSTGVWLCESGAGLCHGRPVVRCRLRGRLRRSRSRPRVAAALPADVELARGDARVVPPRGLVPRRSTSRPDHGLWLPDDHPPPLRLSGVQSGNRSGPVGSTDGQQAVYEGSWSARSSRRSPATSRTAATSRSAAG